MNNRKHTLLHIGKEIICISNPHKFIIHKIKNYDDWQVQLIENLDEQCERVITLYSGSESNCSKFLRMIWGRLLEQKDDNSFYIDIPNLVLTVEDSHGRN